MKYPIAFTAVLALVVGGAVHAADPIGVSGDYVEVRTAEVFTGPCMLGNEADTLGREAIMAWRVTRGMVNGVSLDGLSIVAVVAGDRKRAQRLLDGTGDHDPKRHDLVERRVGGVAAAVEGVEKDVAGRV